MTFRNGEMQGRFAIFFRVGVCASIYERFQSPSIAQHSGYVQVCHVFRTYPNLAGSIRKIACQRQVIPF